MELFLATGNQMIYLFTMILIGFILAKIGVLPDGTARILAVLENNILIPALVMGTFISNFTVEKFRAAGILFASGAVLLATVIPLAILLPRLLVKDRDTRNIYTYGLAFSNFGFMGNSVMLALFPDLFMDYLIFTLPLWIMIYLWGVPQLLMPTSEKQTVASRLKRFFNPMLIGMLIGMIIGITGIPILPPISAVIETLGSGMSPIAMLLTGVTIAGISLKKAVGNWTIYAVTGIRLLLIPLLFLGVFALWNPSDSIVICAICSLAMPLGLNTIVIPSAYGKDPTIASGMALISHLLSCVTIPFIFILLQKITG